MQLILGTVRPPPPQLFPLGCTSANGLAWLGLTWFEWDWVGVIWHGLAWLAWLKHVLVNVLSLVFMVRPIMSWFLVGCMAWLGWLS